MTIDRVSLTPGSEQNAAEGILIFEGPEIDKREEIDIVVREGRKLFKRSIEVSALAWNELTRRRLSGRNLGCGLI